MEETSGLRKRSEGGESSFRQPCKRTKISKSARQQALLIKAQSRVIEAESEVSRLKQEVSISRVKEGVGHVTKNSGVEYDVERLHKLELERCELADELSSVKVKLAVAEKELLESQEKNAQLSKSYDEDTQMLKDQVENLMFQINELDVLNDEMQAELNDIHLLQPEQQLQQVEELKEDYMRSVETMKSRVAQLEDVESKLLNSQMEVKHLQYQLQTCRQDNHFVETMRDRILQCEELKHQVHLLKEENHSLRLDRANTDLLRYKVQSLQKRCEELGGVEEERARLHVENNQLTAMEGSRASMSSPTLQVCLAELQQKEIVALSEYGKLVTELKVHQEELKQCYSSLKQTQALLKQEKASSSVLEERVHKLERRLIFVTKERDGCVNVLNSYKLDSGVDALMKERMTEMEHQLERSKQRIAELEREASLEAAT